MSTPTIAIIGCGPSGCYTAQFLRKQWPDAEISIYDRMPVPFGLVRYGVAPDHVGTKAITRQFARLFERENVNFIGNLEIGKDLELSVLRETYDVVVLATGLYGDKMLNIAGEELQHVYGAGSLTRFFNDHPDESQFTPNFGENCVIIGNGNVAIDVLRLLAKNTDQLDGSEISSATWSSRGCDSLKRIDIVGRSPAELAKFDTVMIRELSQLEQVSFELHDLTESNPALLPATAAKWEALQQLAQHQSQAAKMTIAFRFGWTPDRIEGKENVESITLTSTSNGTERLTLAADSIVKAIGFCDSTSSLIRRDEISKQHPALPTGYIDFGLYCAGWFKRGPQGTIPENRVDAKAVANSIIEHLAGKHTFKAGFAALPASCLKKMVSYQHWKIIDQAETQSSEQGRARTKIKSIKQMLSTAMAQAE